jgi:hypothetical protein
MHLPRVLAHLTATPAFALETSLGRLSPSSLHNYSCPLSPAPLSFLQRAVAATFSELRRSRVRRLLSWGKHLYRAGTLGYAAFSAFSNPYLARAVLAALWTAVRIIGRLGG